MKILLCERSFLGHRKKYMEWLFGIEGIKFYCFAPENFGVPEDRFFRYDRNVRSFIDYFWWIKTILRIVKREKIDIVHFLDGDSMMRFMGLGFSAIRGTKVVVTYHHFYSGMARKLSYHIMSGGKNKIPVVHTDNVRKQFESIGLAKATVCEYPAFDYGSISGREPAECRKYFNIPQNVPVIGIVGGMSDYKNIIPFLEVMQECKEDFHILLCGNGTDSFIEQAKSAVESYADNVTINIRRLSDDEYEMAIMASDIVYCLYNHSFDGASGPLTDGVCADKMILSCAHGSLGSIVTENHLGFTAECTDTDEVLRQTSEALRQTKSFVYDEIAAAYRKSLMPEYFQQTYRRIYES